MSSPNMALKPLAEEKKRILPDGSLDTSDRDTKDTGSGKTRPDPDKTHPDPDKTHPEYVAFKDYAREKYDDLFEELEFRSQRAAMMHFHEANKYSRKCYYMEVTAALIGAVSVSGVGACLLQWNSAGKAGLMSSRLGLFGLLGVVVSAVIEIAGKGSTSLIPTLNKRLVAHKEAAVGWQRMTRLTRSYRIQLRNPALQVGDYVTWYAELVQMRQEVSKVAMVPSATYRQFNDPGRVFVALRRKRTMFLHYQGMHEGKVEVDDDFDDD